MAVMHDHSCEQCGHLFEKMVRWDEETAVCPNCGAMAHRVFLPHHKRPAQAFAPVLIYRDKSGHVRFPGRNEGVAPKGYEPFYLRTTQAVRNFERRMNAVEKERYFKHKERQELRFAQWIGNARSELRQKMQHMSPYGRELAEQAIRANDQQKDVDTRFEPNFHLEAFSYDASNREAHYDRDLQRRK